MNCRIYDANSNFLDESISKGHLIEIRNVGFDVLQEEDGVKVRLDNLDDLLTLMKAVGHRLVLTGGDNTLEIEIYDDYRE